MPLWLMNPSCIVAPSRSASSPDCKPPLIRALNASLLLPVDTPGRSTAKLAEDRGLPETINGRSLTVSGSIPPCTDRDRKSTRLNSSHQIISYSVFSLKIKKRRERDRISLVIVVNMLYRLQTPC